MNPVRRCRATVLIAGTVLVVASATDPASASLSSNTFGATGEVRPGGHAAEVTVVLGCEPEGVFGVEVTVTQGDAVAVGRRRGRCTGAAETYAVTVVTSNGAPLAAGQAEICGEAFTREAGVTDDTHSWCRAAGVDLHEQ